MRFRLYKATPSKLYIKIIFLKGKILTIQMTKFSFFKIMINFTQKLSWIYQTTPKFRKKILLSLGIIIIKNLAILKTYY
jgi:hypothetical protein